MQTKVAYLLNCSLTRLNTDRECSQARQTPLFMTALWNRAGHYIFMVALCNRADHYIFILFLLLLLLLLLLSFFPRLISAVGDWMSTILWHMVWP